MEIFRALKGAYDGAISGYKAARQADSDTPDGVQPRGPYADSILNDLPEINRLGRDSIRSEATAITAVTMAMLGMPGSAFEGDGRQGSVPLDTDNVVSKSNGEAVATIVEQNLDQEDAPVPVHDRPVAELHDIQAAPAVVAPVLIQPTMLMQPSVFAKAPLLHETPDAGAGLHERSDNVISFPAPVSTPTGSPGGGVSAHPADEQVPQGNHFSNATPFLDIRAELLDEAESGDDSYYAQYVRKILGIDNDAHKAEPGTGPGSDTHHPLGETGYDYAGPLDRPSHASQGSGFEL